jgi:predicted deacylase
MNWRCASCFSAVVLSVSGLLPGITLAVSSAIADEIEFEEIEERKLPQLSVTPETASPEIAPTDALVSPVPDETTESDYVNEPVEPVEVQPFRLLDSDVPAGTMGRLSWHTSETLTGLAEATPVLVAHGTKSGPRLCIVAAVHGDELNGIEIVRSLFYGLNPVNLSGTVIGVPIVNLHGFRQGSRYLADRRDLNRYFPGNPGGSSASRIAFSFFNSVVSHCDYLVDLHTGSFHRTNLPQIRADLNNYGVLHLTRGLGATVVLHNRGRNGTLRGAATMAGIPAVALEVGEPMRYQPDEVAHGVKALRSLLNHLDMVPAFRFWREPQPTYYQSNWVRANSEGILKSNVKPGQSVREGDLLGSITDPITNTRSEILSPHNGRILGMSLNQTMMPGYAAYHIGILRTEEELVEETYLEDAVTEDRDEYAESDEGGD